MKLSHFLVPMFVVLTGCSADHAASAERAGQNNEVQARGAESRLYIEERFNGAAFNKLWSLAGFKKEIYEKDKIEAFADFPGHGPALRYYIPQGVDEVTPAQVALEGDRDFLRVCGKKNIDEFYAEWSEYFADGHDFADCGQKILRATYWNEGEPLGHELTFAVLDDNSRIQLFLFHPQGLSDGSGLDVGLDYRASMPTGRWVSFGVWCRLNTPGESDGFARVYMDGKPIITRTQMSLRGKDPRGWNVFWIGGNHSNSAPTAQASHRYIDDILLYSTKPR